MISHGCLTNNTFHMIKHDPHVLQIPCRLHSCDKVDSTLDTTYRHFGNEHLFVHELVLGNNILGCSHIDSWTLIQV